MTKWIHPLAAVLCACIAHSHVAAADAYPSKPVRIVVNTAPGGLTDVVTRLVAQKMGDTLREPFVVENKAGGDGLIGIREVKVSPADGYTLLASAGTIAIQMSMKAQPGYDLLRDFAGIGLMARSPFLIVVAPGKPDQTLKDFVARARSDPKMSYASAGVGTVPHLAMEAFMKQAGIKLMHIPYKGNGAAMPDVMGGRVDTILEAFGSSSGKIASGQLRALGITAAMRNLALPDVPTFTEQGWPGYTFYTWMCLVAPAGTPKVVVQTLSDALRHATASKDIQERYRKDGVEAIEMTPEEFDRFLAKEVARAGALVTELNLTKE